jgi:hypothetical protein
MKSYFAYGHIIIQVFVHVESHEMVNPALKVDQRIYEDMASNFDAESRRSLTTQVL